MKRFAFLRRPYQTYINGIYYVMFGGRERKILSPYRILPEQEKGIVAGISKSGYIILEVLVDSGYERQYFDAHMLD